METKSKKLPFLSPQPASIIEGFGVVAAIVCALGLFIGSIALGTHLYNLLWQAAHNQVRIIDARPHNIAQCPVPPTTLHFSEPNTVRVQ